MLYRLGTSINTLLLQTFANTPHEFEAVLPSNLKMYKLQPMSVFPSQYPLYPTFFF